MKGVFLNEGRRGAGLKWGAILFPTTTIIPRYQQSCSYALMLIFTRHEGCKSDAKHALIAVILAYSRSAYDVYAYLLIKTATSMLCDESMFCIAQADNITENQRASAFGILSGIACCAFV